MFHDTLVPFAERRIIKMKNILKNNSWDMDIIEEYYYFCFNKSIQKVNRISKKIEKTLKMRKEYYLEIYVCPERNLIVAFSIIGNCVDIIDAETLELQYSFQWLGKKCFEREKILCDTVENGIIYCILYDENKQTSCITKISLDTRKEEVIRIINRFYSNVMIYDGNKNDILICGKKFDKNSNSDAEGKYIGIWGYHSEDTIYFEDANNAEYDLENVWISGTREIYYTSFYVLPNDIGKQSLSMLGNNNKLFEEIDYGVVANKLFVYIINDELYLYSLEKKKILDKVQVEYEYNSSIRIKKLNDNFIYFRNEDNLYLYQI